MKITRKKVETLTFESVEISEPTVDDLLKAERIAGKSEGLEFMLVLLSQVGTFDGKALPPEELRRLSGKDFLDISMELQLPQEAASAPPESDVSSSISAARGDLDASTPKK